jgi:hypothetical protein
VEQTLVAQTFPLGWINLGKGFDYGGIELNATEFEEFVERCLIWSATSIWPV